MKNADLVNELAKFTSTKKEAAMTMEIFLNLIKRTLKKREEIFLPGFGTFTIVKRKARKGRNPKTGEAIRIAAKVIPKFKPAKAFKEAVK
ncbi:MAG: HU family DNA-binding protein [Smithellaceae bacterium]